MKKQKTDLPNDGNLTYLILIAVVVIVPIVWAISLEYLLPDKDNSSLLVQIFSLAILVIPIIMTFIQARETRKDARETLKEAREAKEQTIETHLKVNSQLEQWKEDFFKLAFSQGEKQGRVDADKRTDDLKEAEKK